MSDPIRTCVGCRTRESQRLLVRLAWDEAAAKVVLDPARRLPGRGAWVHPAGECLARAVSRRALSRALRRTVAAEATAHLLD